MKINFAALCTKMSSLIDPWHGASGAAKELVRRGAEIAQSLPPDWLEELDAAISIANGGQEGQLDPVLLEASKRSARAELLHWANASLRNPCEPVEPLISPDMVEVAQELTRQGIPEVLMGMARSTQSTFSSIWMRTMFRLTSDPRLLEELLHISSRLISSYFDSSMRNLARIIDDERSLMEKATHVDRRYVLTRLLDGRTTDVALARRQLNYDIGMFHQAGIIWSLAPDAQLRQLEEMALAASKRQSEREPLIVLAGPATLWFWFHASSPLLPSRLDDLARQHPGIQLALGSTGKGLDGFRRSHLEALTTQRVMSSVAGDARIASFDQVHLVSLINQESSAASYFINSTLGRLCKEPAELQRSLYVFLAEGCNLTKAAAVLGTHRNTLLRRLERAESLLPFGLDEHRIQVGAALHALLWSKRETPEPR